MGCIRNYLVRKNTVTFEQSYRSVQEMNLDEDETSLTFKAGVIFLYGATNQEWNIKKLHKASQQGFWITKNEIRKIVFNWHEYNIIDSEGTINAEFNEDDPLAWMIEFTLVSMCGAGIVARQCVTNETEPEIFIIDGKKIAPLPKRSIRVKHNGEDFWVKPVSLEGRLLTCRVETLICKIHKAGQIVECDVSEIYQIAGKRKHEVEEIKKEITGEIEVIEIEETRTVQKFVAQPPYEFYNPYQHETN